MTDDLTKSLASTFNGNKQSPVGADNNLIIGTMKSGLSSAMEMFGTDPLEGTQAFRAKNPGLSLIGDLIGPGGVYVKGYKMARGSKKLEKFREGFGDINKNPFSTGAARDLISLAPLEAARLGSATFLGNGENFNDVLSSVAFDAAITAPIGAIGAGIRAFGKRAKDAKPVIPGVNLRDAEQLQMREIMERMKLSTNPAEMPAFHKGLKNLEAEIRLQHVSPKEAIKDLVNKTPEQVKQLSRLLNDWEGKSVSRIANTAQQGLGSREKLAEVVKKLNWRTEDFAHIQHPRWINFDTGGAGPKALKNFKRTLRKDSDVQIDGMSVTREQNGLYNVFKEVSPNEYAFFRTDRPIKFMSEPRKGYFAKVAPKMGFQSPNLKNYKQADIEAIDPLRMIHNFDEAFPMQDLRGMPEGKSGFKEGGQMLAKKLGISTPEELKEVGGRLGETFKRYFAPTVFKIAKNPRSRWMWAQARSTKDQMDAWSQQVLHGSLDLDKNLFKFVRGKTKANSDKSLFGFIDDLAEGEVAQLWKAVEGTWSKELQASALAGKEITPQVNQVLDLLRALDDKMVGQLTAVNGLRGGRTEFTPMADHLAAARTWRGDYRITIKDELGKMVHVASGRTRREAQDEAKHVIDGAKSESMNWKLGSEMKGHSVNDDAMLAARLNPQSLEGRTARAWTTDYRGPKENTPSTFKDRKNVGGYTAAGRQELKDVVEDHLRRNTNYITRESYMHAMEPEFVRLANDEAGAAAGLMESVDQLFGTPGKVSQFQNEVVDKIMSPILGKDSASKIVAAANRGMMNLQLGMFNMQFPLLNALTYMQTTLPQMAFVMNSAPADIAKYYSWVPSMNAGGKVGGSIGFFDSIKLGYQSMKTMREAPPELMALMHRATREGVVDPRLVEEFVGANSITASNMAKTFKDDYAEGVLKLSEALPGVSEKFARTHTFTTGYTLGKDILRIKDQDKLYQFVKEFTNNTMFLYSAADRARVITGPIGSMFGMFKNWQMHYMGWMFEYANQGMVKGNWSPLMWQTAGTGLVGGIGGLPLAGTAELFSEWATGKGVLEHTYDMFAGDNGNFGNVADGIFMGLPGFLGVSLQDSASAPLADPARDASMLMSFVHYDRAKALGTAIGGAMDTWNATGEHPIKDQQVLDQFIRALSPRSMYRATSVMEGDYIKSMRNGNPMVQGLSAAERMMVGAGFSPSFVSRSYEFAAEAWDDQEKLRTTITTFGRLWSDAIKSNDIDALTNLQKQMMAKNIDFGSVMRSAQAHGRRDHQDVLDKAPDILKGREEFLRR